MGIASLTHPTSYILSTFFVCRYCARIRLNFLQCYRFEFQSGNTREKEYCYKSWLRLSPFMPRRVERTANITFELQVVDGMGCF
jgi:hypothetical protein